MKIEIEDLSFNCIIGILDFERKKEQKVVVNLKAKYSYKNGEFINYVTLCDIIKSTTIKGKFELLEDALLANKEAILKEFPNITKLHLKISKPDILKDAKVSLSIEIDN